MLKNPKEQIAATAGMLGDHRSFEQLLLESDTPMLLLDQGAVIQDINPAATTLLGGRREDYVGKEIFALVDPADRYFLQEKWRDSDSGGQTMWQYTVRLRISQRPSDWHTLSVETGAGPSQRPMRLVRLQHLSTTRSRA